MSFGEMNPNDPCTKDCKDSCVGCKSNCVKYLEYVVFDCIADGVRYIRDKYISGKSEGSIRYGIHRAISNNETYMGFYFRRIENVSLYIN